MWPFRTKFKFDENVVQYLLGEVSILKSKTNALEMQGEQLKTQINSIRGRVNQSKKTREDVDDLSPEEEAFYKTTIEYNELMKGQGLRSSKNSDIDA